jgi:hypothetical protein
MFAQNGIVDPRSVKSVGTDLAPLSRDHPFDLKQSAIGAGAIDGAEFCRQFPERAAHQAEQAQQRAFSDFRIIRHSQLSGLHQR